MFMHIILHTYLHIVIKLAFVPNTVANTAHLQKFHTWLNFLYFTSCTFVGIIRIHI